MANDPIRPSASAPVAPRPVVPPPGASAPRPSATTSFLSYLFRGTTRPGEIVVYHHSSLFYWWPVWAAGFIMALISYFQDDRMAVVPSGTAATTASQGEATIEGRNVDLKDRDVLVLGEHRKHLTRKDAAGAPAIVQPVIHVSHHRGLGSIFLFILLLVIAITNVHMRGLWSFFVLLVIVLLTIIFAVAGLWESIFAHLGHLSVYINMGGYLLMALVLFILWVVNFWIFDRQTYMIFTPGQVRMRLEIGGGETVYDTTGMVVQKYRSDLFRHWILGFGSGDLVIRPAGGSHAIEMPNVLNVSRKVRQIENMVKEKVVLAQP